MATKSKSKHEQCADKGNPVKCCSLPKIAERDLSHISDGNRARLISQISKMWVNGTELTYYFFNTANLRGGSVQEQAVRDAFDTWKQLGIGLNFREVDSASDAIVKVGFDHNDGSWSYVGRDCLKHAAGPKDVTTNFGWDLTTPYGRDTALHELGHVLGFPHEHQNPLAGIVWDEEAVYASLGGAPNFWSREQTYWNIIRKIEPNSVDGSDWDRNSIMHYTFDAGLILEPAQYRTVPLLPESGLSPVDIDTVKLFFPPQQTNNVPELREFESQLFTILPAQQLDFVIRPLRSRKYTIATFGESDSVMVLFEVRNGVEEYIAGDDDSGYDANANITVRLHRGRQYIIRTRLYYAQSQGSGCIMLY
jgi:hypothetical protein